MGSPQFIEQQAEQVSFIDEEWLFQAIRFDEFDQQIEDGLREHVQDLERSSYRLTWHDEWEGLEFTGYVNRVADIDAADAVSNFYVYETSDGTLYVEATYCVEYELGFTVGERVRVDFIFSEPWHRDFDVDLADGIEIRYKTVYKCAEAEIVLELE